MSLMFYVQSASGLYRNRKPTEPLSTLLRRYKDYNALYQRCAQLKLIEPATPLNRRRKNIMQIEIYTSEGWIPN